MTEWYSLVVGEVQLLMTIMRRNRKWRTDTVQFRSRQGGAGSSLIHQFSTLRSSLTLHSEWCDVDHVAVVLPFVNTILSPETSGDITGMALWALHRFITAGLFDKDDQGNSPDAMTQIGRSLTQCRFEATDSKTDEVVLMKIFQIECAALDQPAGAFLSDAAVWEMVQTCYRIYGQLANTYSEILRHAVQTTLSHLFRCIFQRLGTVAIDPAAAVTSPLSPTSQPDPTAVADPLCALTDAPCRSTSTMPTSMPTTHDSTKQGGARSGARHTHSSTKRTQRVQHRAPGYGLPCAHSAMKFLEKLMASLDRFDEDCELGAVDWELDHPVLSPRVSMTEVSPPSERAADAESPTEILPGTSSSPPTSDGPADPFAFHSTSTLSPPSASPPRLHSSYIPLERLKTRTECHDRSVLTAQLLLAMLEAAGRQLTRFPRLVLRVQDRISRFVLRAGRSDEPLLVSLGLRLLLLLLLLARDLLPLQLELAYKTFFLRLLDNKGESSSEQGYLGNGMDAAGNSYALREVALEGLLDLCSIPWFSTELFVNFDCHPSAPDFFSSLCRSLCKAIFPVNKALLTGNHVLSLRCVHALLSGMQARAEGRQWLLPAAGVCSASLLQEQRRQKARLGQCIAEFNKKPKKGMLMMESVLGMFTSLPPLKDRQLNQDYTVSDQQTKDIGQLALLLRTDCRFDKVQVGEYLGAGGVLAHLLRARYLNTFNFKGQTLDEAMRMFLSAFRLPREAQQIDRVLEAFAERWDALNKGQLADAGVAHVLSFSLIMLNTDAHNDQVKRKMTLKQWFQNNRGINGGADVPHELLETLYYTIKRRAIKLHNTANYESITDTLWRDLRTQATLRKWTYVCLRTEESGPDEECDSNGQHLPHEAARDSRRQSVHHSLHDSFLPCSVAPDGIAEWPSSSTNPESGGEAEAVAGGSDVVGVKEEAIHTHEDQSTQQSAGQIDAQTGPRSVQTQELLVVERDMLSICWEPLLAALSTLLGSCTEHWEEADEGGMEAPQVDVPGHGHRFVRGLVGSCLTSMAALAHAHGMTTSLEQIVTHLFRLSGLLDEDWTSARWQTRADLEQARAGLVERFVQRPEAKPVTQLAFRLCHEYGRGLVQSWRCVLQAILQLQIMEVVPMSMLRLDDMASNARSGRGSVLTHIPKQRATATSVAPTSALTALFGSVSSYFLLASNEEASQSHEAQLELLATQKPIQEFVAGCDLPRIFSTDSTKLPISALRTLLQTLLDICGLDYIAEASSSSSPSSSSSSSSTSPAPASSSASAASASVPHSSSRRSSGVEWLTRAQWAVDMSRQAVLQCDVETTRLTAGFDFPRELASQAPNNNPKANNDSNNGSDDSNNDSAKYPPDSTSEQRVVQTGVATEEFGTDSPELKGDKGEVEAKARGTAQGVHPSVDGKARGAGQGTHPSKSSQGTMQSAETNMAQQTHPWGAAQLAPVHYLSTPCLIRQCLLCLELVTMVATANTHRLATLFPLLLGQLASILHTASPRQSRQQHHSSAEEAAAAAAAATATTTTAAAAAATATAAATASQGRFPAWSLPERVVEAAVASLMRMALSLLHLDHMHKQVVGGLALLLALDMSRTSLAEQVMGGLLKIVQAHGANIQDRLQWQVLLQLVRKGLRTASRRVNRLAFQALREIIEHGPPCAVSMDLLALHLRLVLTVSKSAWALQPPKHLKRQPLATTPPAPAPQATPQPAQPLVQPQEQRQQPSPSASPERPCEAVQCVLLLHILCKRLATSLMKLHTSRSSTPSIHSAALSPSSSSSLQSPASFLVNPPTDAGDTGALSPSNIPTHPPLPSTHACDPHLPNSVPSQLSAPDAVSGVQGAIEANDSIRPHSMAEKDSFDTIWRKYCRPLLLAFRYVCQIPSFALIPPTPPASHGFVTVNRAQPAHGQQMLLSLLAVRQQSVLSLRQLLVSDNFAVAVALAADPSRAGECSTNMNSCVPASLPTHSASPPAMSLEPTPSSSSSSSGSPYNAMPTSLVMSGPAYKLRGSAVQTYGSFWQAALDEVVFPLLKDLALPDPAWLLGPTPHRLRHDRTRPTSQRTLLMHRREAILDNMAKVRNSAVALLSKAYLRCLPQLQRKPTLHLTWLHVLTSLETYVGIKDAAATDDEAASCTLVVECVQETLKNLVLVMAGNGVFAAGKNTTGQELWNLTWLVVEPFCPSLKHNLFPQGTVKQRHATTAIDTEQTAVPKQSMVSQIAEASQTSSPSPASVGEAKSCTDCEKEVHSDDVSGGLAEHTAHTDTSTVPFSHMSPTPHTQHTSHALDAPSQNYSPSHMGTTPAHISTPNSRYAASVAVHTTELTSECTTPSGLLAHTAPSHPHSVLQRTTVTTDTDHQHPTTNLTAPTADAAPCTHQPTSPDQETQHTVALQQPIDHEKHTERTMQETAPAERENTSQATEHSAPSLDPCQSTSAVDGPAQLTTADPLPYTTPHRTSPAPTGIFQHAADSLGTTPPSQPTPPHSLPAHIPQHPPDNLQPAPSAVLTDADPKLPAYLTL